VSIDYLQVGKRGSKILTSCGGMYTLNRPVQRIVDGEVVDTMTNRYIVIDMETESRKEKKFEVGFTTKRNFDTALRTGHRIYKCTNQTDAINYKD
jgi:hypothetical protein